MLAVTAVSNVLGTVNPIVEIVKIAHAHGVPVLVDAAQAAARMQIDVSAWDCDFLAFSGHKIYFAPNFFQSFFSIKNFFSDPKFF